MADIRTTSQLDDFSGSFEDPLSNGGKWAQLDTLWNPLLRDGGGQATTEVGASFGWSYWTLSSFDGDVEVWGHAVGGQSGAAGDGWRLGLWTDVGGNTAADGYAALAFFNPTPLMQIRKYSNTSPTTIATGTPMAIYTDIWFLFRRRGDDLEYWESGDAANWTLIASVTDTTYTTSMYMGIACEDLSASQLNGWDSFGGGDLGDWQPEFIRRPWEHQGFPPLIIP